MAQVTGVPILGLIKFIKRNMKDALPGIIGLLPLPGIIPLRFTRRSLTFELCYFRNYIIVYFKKELGLCLYTLYTEAGE